MYMILFGDKIRIWTIIEVHGFFVQCEYLVIWNMEKKSREQEDGKR